MGLYDAKGILETHINQKSLEESGIPFERLENRAIVLVNSKISYLKIHQKTKKKSIILLFLLTTHK